MPTLAQQAVTDCDLQFSADLPWVSTVTYNGTDIQAIISPGEDRDEVQDGAFGGKMVIDVRRADVDTVARRTEVIIDGAKWTVWASLGHQNPLKYRLSLVSGVSPAPRRSLP